MGKLLFSALFLMTTSLITYSQGDCAFYYCYKGRISYVNENKYDSVIIRVPKPYNLKKDFNNQRTLNSPYFDIISLELGEEKFCKEFYKLGPCKLDPTIYLSRVFIDNIKNYRLIIQTGNIHKIVIFDITKMIFSIQGNKITIEFPEIRM